MHIVKSLSVPESVKEAEAYAFDRCDEIMFELRFNHGKGIISGEVLMHELKKAYLAGKGIGTL